MRTLLLLAACTISAAAQIMPAGPSGISYGHLHLNGKDPAVHQRFWVDVMNAQTGKLGANDLYKVPGTLVVVNKAANSAGTEGSTVDHISLKVQDLKGTVAKAEAAQFAVLNRAKNQVTIAGPEGLKVVLTDAGSKPLGIDFATDHVEEMKKWYETTFGADIPGVELRFASAATAPAGTKGRVLDHIGFEVKGLEAFSKKLEASGVKFNVPYREIPAIGIHVAFFTDPWGTYIELTEGLDKFN